jgi:Ca2+-transporting ATPase
VAEDTELAERFPMLHAGTLVVHGSGSAIVTATGAHSQLGQIADLLHTRAAPDTPLQRRLARLGQRLAAFAVLCCALVVALGVLRGQPWELMTVAGISLAVAAIPESLPAVVALALAAATRRMAERGAVVRLLPAVEALGSVTVLASDKTGTLTTGNVTCTTIWTPERGEQSAGTPADVTELAQQDRGPTALLQAAALCNDAEPGAPGTEGALVAAAATAGLDVSALRHRYRRTHVIPFDSIRRTMVTRHTVGDAELEIVKGAPEYLLPTTSATTAVESAARGTLERWTGTGARVLAVAAGPPGAPRLLGMVALADPVRPDARAAVLAARAAGIHPVMITGDHPRTALAVAHATGIIADNDPAAADPRVARRPVYARTNPTGKLDIIASWQEAGHLVAMTGDGVNDAPALRAADVGVAMGRRGTEVAKEAADIVLTDDSLETLVTAIAEGRRVFDNVRRFVRYGLAGGLAELLVMFLGPFFGLPLPLLPGQILWVNLVTHGLPGVAIGSEVAEPDVLQRPPRPPSEGILTRRTVAEIAVIGTLITSGCLILALWASAHQRPWQTLLFTTLALAQLGVALTTRSDRTPCWRMAPAGNPFLFIAVVASVGATVAAVYLPGLSVLLATTPLRPAELVLSLGVAAVPAVAIELIEVMTRARNRPESADRGAAGTGQRAVSR